MGESDSGEWTTSGLELFLDPGLPHGRGLRARIEDALRDAIRSGRLPRGTRLPPTRALARDLGASRGTVVQAYAQLAAEGWIAGRRGSATIVAADSGHREGASALREPRAERPRLDLRPGRPDSGSFPRADWLRALRRALASAPDGALGYDGPQGQPGLRAELAGYLARARGLRVSPRDLLITTGFTQSLALIARAFAADGPARIAIEQPSMPLHRASLRAAGHELVLVPIDEHGLRVDELPGAGDIAAVVLTPNRQHPTGVALSAARRSQLLAWARAGGAYVVEDDYDGEFRYDTQPIGPLQGLDPGVVIYAGTAAKTLAPGIRLGWLALPDAVRAAVMDEKELADGLTGALEQLAFAELLRSGAYDRHIRRMRLRYRRRRDALISALERGVPGAQITGAAAGLNLLLRLADAEAEDAVLAAARRAGLAIDGLRAGQYDEAGGPAGIIVGYAAAPEHQFARAVEVLVDVLGSVVR